jgi:hypothetical protein
VNPTGICCPQRSWRAMSAVGADALRRVAMTRRHVVVQWDNDRYEQLQDSAWELERLAVEQEKSVNRYAGLRMSETSRMSASALRQEAAHLLAMYWTPRTPESR